MLYQSKKQWDQQLQQGQQGMQCLESPSQVYPTFNPRISKTKNEIMLIASGSLF